MSKEGNYRGWVIVAVSFLILMFIFATCISCMGVYLKPVTDEFGISRTDFSLITTMQAFAKDTYQYQNTDDDRCPLLQCMFVHICHSAVYSVFLCSVCIDGNIDFHDLQYTDFDSY